MHLRRISQPVYLLALFTFLLFYTTPKADVPYIPYSEEIFLGDIEGICSIEYDYDSHWSFLLWGGADLSHGFITNHNAFGLEAAVEPRIYFISHLQNSGLFVSAYLGNALMFMQRYHWGNYTGIDNSYGITSGIKFGYKLSLFKTNNLKLNRLFSVEPYLSVAKSFYWSDGFDMDEYPVTTLGVRFVAELPFRSQKKPDTYINVEEVK